MDPKLILSEKCSQSAQHSASTICNLAQQRNLPIDAIIKPFQRLVPQLDWSHIEDWLQAEEVIAQACFILEAKYATKLAKNNPLWLEGLLQA